MFKYFIEISDRSVGAPMAKRKHDDGVAPFINHLWRCWSPRTRPTLRGLRRKTSKGKCVPRQDRGPGGFCQGGGAKVLQPFELCQAAQSVWLQENLQGPNVLEFTHRASNVDTRKNYQGASGNVKRLPRKGCQ